MCGDRLQRIGLSATQNPIRSVADFLAGAAADAKPAAEVAIIDAGHQRRRDLSLEVPGSPLEAVMSKEVWGQVYARLTELIAEHRTTLVFVNTRRMAERIARELTDRLGEQAVTAHHGSMAKELRLAAEQRLKRGELKALVATASLELGIDIGDVNLVCQIGSPRSIATFLQRVGRSGHAIGGTPKGRLFPLSRDDLVECTALIDSVRRGELDRLVMPDRPLDVLAQQVVAEVAAQDWPEAELYDRLRRAWPFRSLAREDFDAILRMLAEGFTTRRGRRGALIHRDAVNRILRGRRGARTTALTSGGTIPDTADYQVLLEPENLTIGTVNEDFAIESMAGDIFQLGNTSYRIQRVERGTVRVEDAKGLPPTIPFWLGEAPGRTDELSVAVSRLRAEIAAMLRSDSSGTAARRWLVEQVGVAAARGRSARRLSRRERFRSWLNADAGCDRLRAVLRRGGRHATRHSLAVRQPPQSRLGIGAAQALLPQIQFRAAGGGDRGQYRPVADHRTQFRTRGRRALPPFGERAQRAHPGDAGRADVHHALALGGGRVACAPPLSRRQEGSAAALAHAGGRPGRGGLPRSDRLRREFWSASGRSLTIHSPIRRSPIVCTRRWISRGWSGCCGAWSSGKVRVVGCDLTEPSPLALEALSARPYAFLDDAPLEERRTQAVMARRWRDPESASDLGRLDPEAIAKVQSEAWPDPVNAEELHDALLWLGSLTEAEARAASGWSEWLEALARDRRVARLKAPQATLWIPAERLVQFRAVWPEAKLEPEIAPPADQAEATWPRDEALTEILRGRLEGLGPVTPTALAAPLGLEADAIAPALAALERDGAILKGRFLAGVNDEQWCDRRLLARIHHYTVRRLRSEIEPVAARDFLRFLFAWAHVSEETRLEGPDALPAVLSALEGFEAPAKAWETEILPARLKGYQASWLDAQCLAGRTSWARLTPPAPANGRARHVSPVGATPIALIERRRTPLWMALAPSTGAAPMSGRAQAVLDALSARGALFFDELMEAARLLRPHLEEALGELVALGLAASDSFGGLRALLVPSGQRKPLAGAKRRGRVLSFDIESGGRWAMINRDAPQNGGAEARDAAVEYAARTLLARYGVVFWRLLTQEPGWLPPWRDLLRVYRRLEARGEIRGGRFVAGFSGEQFALPDAVGLLREMRRRPASGEWVSLSGADPLNLIGILTPGQRLSALTANRVVYRDGLPVAALTGGKTQFLTELETADQWEAEKRLVRSAARGRLADLV